MHFMKFYKQNRENRVQSALKTAGRKYITKASARAGEVGHSGTLSKTTVDRRRTVFLSLNASLGHLSLTKLWTAATRLGRVFSILKSKTR